MLSYVIAAFWAMFLSKVKNDHFFLLFFRLERCNFTFKSCGLGLEHSCLTALDLSDNDVQDSGMKQLMNSLKNPSCKLQKLRLCFHFSQHLKNVLLGFINNNVYKLITSLKKKKI